MAIDIMALRKRAAEMAAAKGKAPAKSPAKGPAEPDADDTSGQGQLPGPLAAVAARAMERLRK